MLSRRLLSVAFRRSFWAVPACLIAMLSMNSLAAAGEVRSHEKTSSKRASTKACAKKKARRETRSPRRAKAKSAKAKRRAVKCKAKKRTKARSQKPRTVPPTPAGEVTEPPAASPTPWVTPTVPAAPGLPATPPTLLFSPNYDLGLTSWQARQQPPGTQRLTTTTAPGEAGSAYRPSGKVMRAEVRHGEVTNTSGYLASRSEVYARVMKPASTAAEGWPDPVGSERWYAFDLYVPAAFPTATDATWLTLTQWKGQYGGSPPVALEIKRNDIWVGGKRGWGLPSGNLGPLEKGKWTRLVVGLKFSPDPAVGWIEVYRNGERKIARTRLATMDRTSRGADPVYLKQGIYRTSKWNVTQALYFSPVKVYAGGPHVDPLTLG